MRSLRFPKTDSMFGVRAYCSSAWFPPHRLLCRLPSEAWCLRPPANPKLLETNYSHTLLSTLHRTLFQKCLADRHYLLSWLQVSHHSDCKTKKNSGQRISSKKFPNNMVYVADHKTGNKCSHQADFIILLIAYYKRQTKFLNC